MRALIRQLLLAHEPFAALFPDIFSSSAVPLGKEPPFAVVRMGVVLRGQGSASVRSMSLWLHDTPGDYGRIDSGLSAARTALDVWGLTTPTTDLMRAQWMGLGEDGYDDGFKTIVRQGRWELTGAGD